MELKLKAGFGNQQLWDQMSINEDDSNGTKLLGNIMRNWTYTYKTTIQLD